MAYWKSSRISIHSIVWRDTSVFRSHFTCLTFVCLFYFTIIHQILFLVSAMHKTHLASIFPYFITQSYRPSVYLGAKINFKCVLKWKIRMKHFFILSNWTVTTISCCFCFMFQSPLRVGNYLSELKSIRFVVVEEVEVARHEWGKWWMGNCLLKILSRIDNRKGEGRCSQNRCKTEICIQFDIKIFSRHVASL
jgi:hypothetical protein